MTADEKLPALVAVLAREADAATATAARVLDAAINSQDDGTVARLFDEAATHGEQVQRAASALRESCTDEPTRLVAAQLMLDAGVFVGLAAAVVRHPREYLERMRKQLPS